MQVVFKSWGHHYVAAKTQRAVCEHSQRARFGLAALDLATQERTLRPSGQFYSAIASANALTPNMVRQFVTDAR